MPSREVVIETRLQLNNEVTDYIDSYVTDYSSIKRQMWQEMTSKEYSTRFKSLGEYERYCRFEYNLLGRTVNSIVHEIQGLMNLYMELKKTELESLEVKIKNKQAKINKIKVALDLLNSAVARNKNVETNLNKLHLKKQSLYYQKKQIK